MSQALQGLVDSIVAATAGLPDPQTLASWSPSLSGELDLRICDDGTWLHAGAPIRREGLVRLFASLLRREADGAYYLVTPVEKWRVRVDRHALQVVDFDRTGTNGDAIWYALLNTGGRCHLGGPYTLHAPDPAGAGAPWMELPNGLTGQLTRAAWYRLVNDAALESGRATIESGGQTIDLGSLD
jgi:hypothetical protein